MSGYTFQPQHTHTLAFTPKPPPVVGYWVLVEGVNGIGEVRYHAYVRPRWLHRHAIRLMFGWRWKAAA